MRPGIFLNNIIPEPTIKAKAPGGAACLECKRISKGKQNLPEMTAGGLLLILIFNIDLLEIA